MGQLARGKYGKTNPDHLDKPSAESANKHTIIPQEREPIRVSSLLLLSRENLPSSYGTLRGPWAERALSALHLLLVQT